MPLTDLTANALNSLEPQRQNNILLFITGLAEHDAVSGQLVLSLESFPIPKRSVGVIEASHLNEKRKYAGNPQYDDLQIVYKDFCDTGAGSVAALLNDWWLQVHDATTGKTGFATAYKKNACVRLYAPDGTLDRQWNVWGIWPSSFDPGDADQSAEDFVRVNMTLSIDKVTLSATTTAPAAYPATPT